MGVSRAATFRRITVPLCWPGILTGMVLAFAHTVGEFGVVLMVGGNIPGVTRTISVAIYDDVQALNYASAAQSQGAVDLCLRGAVADVRAFAADDAAMTPLLVADFEKRFAGGPTIRGQLQIPATGAGITVLFGPSGCGKTTIRSALAGLERPDAGSVEFDGEIWCDATSGISFSPQRRGVGFLFQHYALFPHLTVAENVAYGLIRRDAANVAAQVACDPRAVADR